MYADTIMGLLGIWFCILTNCMAALPSYMLYKRKMVQDSILAAVTGISSLLYHGNNSDPSVFQQILNTRGIRNTDVILSYLLTFHTTHMVMFKRKKRRLGFTTAMIPLAIYIAECDLYIRVVVILLHSVLGLCYSLYSKHKMNWIALGYVLGIIDVFIMWLGDFKYVDQYYWIHGTHHITCFGAVACMVKSIEHDTKEKVDIEMVFLTPKRDTSTNTGLKHRRCSSMSNALVELYLHE
jgi:hypothetical protein